MPKQNTTIKFVVKDKMLLPVNDVERHKNKRFLEEHKEGTIIECYYSVNIDSSSGSLSQLAKVHAMIKELANTTGYNSREMKDIIKDQAGLHFNGGLKSFGDCSKTELSDAIEACIQLGSSIGCSLH